MAETRRSLPSLSSITAGASTLPLLILFGLSAVDNLDRAAFGVLLPEIRNWFGVSIAEVLTLQAVAGILTLLVAVPIGFLSDRVNRVRLTAVAAFMWGVM